MSEFAHLVHRHAIFPLAILLSAENPRESLVVVPHAGRFLFFQVPGSSPVPLSQRAAIAEAARVGIEIPSQYLTPERSTSTKEPSPWRAIAPGEERTIPPNDILHRLWPQVPGLSLRIENGNVVVRRD